MITIDGSRGEGGGQILRSALALSLVTGKPFCIKNIRSKRAKPGLMRQHLTAVNAAAEVGNSETRGAAIGSQELFFAPQEVRHGSYNFAVGTAGSATLVLQTVLPALLLGAPEQMSVLTQEGGTHNPLAPPFDFLAHAFLPLLNRMGPRIETWLDRPGFYPAGGGKFTVSIQPTPKLQRLDLLERGEIIQRSAESRVAHISIGIAEKQIGLLREKLLWPEECFHTKSVRDSQGPGNILIVEIKSEHITEVFTGFGERGVSSEQVVAGVTREVSEYLDAGVPVGPHLADQLLIPMALAGGGKFRTVEPTPHTSTNTEVIQQFLEIPIAKREIKKGVWEISVG
ncbi:TPA: RNA 3'-terminal phosphate cyclase [Candidatus Sumerlaeota bacterium]|nr:RNA 3'-terminal phosphate cyclase [Candidatus Sumerlaeota bacterium]